MKRDAEQSCFRTGHDRLAKVQQWLVAQAVLVDVDQPPLLGDVAAVGVGGECDGERRT